MSVPGFVIVSDDETGENSTIHTAVTDKSGIQKLVTLSEVSSLQDELPTGEGNPGEAVKFLRDGERLHYQCGLCVKTFLSLKSLIRHKKRLHPEAPQEEELTVILSPSSKRKRLSGMGIHAQNDVSMTTIKHLMATTPLKPDLLVKDQYLAAELAAELQQLETKHARKRPRYNCKKEHKCSICGKNFATPSLLRRHHVVHTGEKPYHCQLCEKKYSQIERLKRHMGKHTGENIFTCKACGKRFEEKCRYIDHVRSHIDEKPYECEVCGKIFTNRVGLWKHKSIHGEKREKSSEYESMAFRFHCEVCMKHFKLEKELIRHTRTHTGEAPDKPYKCQHCSKPFSRKILMVTHERSHTGERPFKCEYCKKTFACQRTMANHVKLHVLAAIGTSNKTDGDLPETAAPTDGTHSQQPQSENLNLFQQRSTAFRCDVCFQYFQRRSSLSAHYKAQHDSVKTVQFRCQCGLHFDSLEAVTAHTRNDHENLDNSVQFSCIVCSQSFQSEENLSSHYVANHANQHGPLEFKCHQCGELFNSVEAVNAHTHTEHENPSGVDSFCTVPATTASQEQVGFLDTRENIASSLYQGHLESASLHVRDQTYRGTNFNQGHVAVTAGKSAVPPPEMDVHHLQLSAGDYTQTNQTPVGGIQASDGPHISTAYSIQQDHVAMRASNWHVGSGNSQVGYTAEKAGMDANMTNWPSGNVVKERSTSVAPSWTPDFSTMQQLENMTSVHQVTQWANSVEEMASEEVFSTTASNVGNGSGNPGITAPSSDQITASLKNSLKASQAEEGPTVPDRCSTFAPVSLLEEYMPPRRTRRKSI